VHCGYQSTTDHQDDEQRLHLYSLTLFIRFAFKDYGTYQKFWRMLGCAAAAPWSGKPFPYGFSQ
jgi:hypothetical protein